MNEYFRKIKRGIRHFRLRIDILNSKRNWNSHQNFLKVCKCTQFLKKYVGDELFLYSAEFEPILAAVQTWRDILVQKIIELDKKLKINFV